MIPIFAGFGTNQRGPKSGQGKLADLDALYLAKHWGQQAVGERIPPIAHYIAYHIKLLDLIQRRNLTPEAIEDLKELSRFLIETFGTKPQHIVYHLGSSTIY